MNEDSQLPPITLFLRKWQQGDADALDQLTQYVYNDLRRRASAYLRHERSELTLQTTDLVHEAFIKLHDKREIEWEDRNHFFAVAAKAMRRILVDHARAKQRDKRGGGIVALPLDDLRNEPPDTSRIDLVALDEALANLAAFDERAERIVELKYFGGMTLDEAADVIGISRATVKRDWQAARAWLRQQMS